MDTFLTGLSTGLTWLLRSSWQGALLVVVILAVQAVFRGRLSPQWRHALWGLLILRLLLVWAPPAPWSLYNVLGPEAPVAVYLAPAPEAPAAYAPVIEAPAQAEGPLPAAIATPQPISSNDRSRATNFGGALGARDAVTLGWLGVTALLLSAMLYQTLRFGRHVRAGRLVTDSATLDLLEECRSRLRVSTYLAVVETVGVRSPALMGCIRPKLLLPRGFLADLSREDLRYIFLHELAHVKRGDIWSSWLMNLVTAAHWFNPFIWYARRRFIADREAACDAHVLAALDESGQRAYGHTVLNLMQRFNATQWAPGIAGISETDSNLRRRILMIKHFRSPTRLAAWVGAGLCVAIGLATLTNAQEAGRDVNAIRKEAVGLAEQGRFNEAIALLDKGRLLSGDVWDEFSALIVRYKLTGDVPLTSTEKEYLVRQLESASGPAQVPESVPQNPVATGAAYDAGAVTATTATRAWPTASSSLPVTALPPGTIPGGSQVSYLEEQLVRLQDLQKMNEKDPASSIYHFGIEKLAITDPRVSALETELAKLEVEADRLREEYVEGHPVLAKSLQEVDTLRKNIAKQTAIARANAIKIMRSEVTQQLELAKRAWEIARTQDEELKRQWAAREVQHKEWERQRAAREMEQAGELSREAAFDTETGGEETLVEVVDGNVVVTRTVPGAFGTPRETARRSAADSGVASSGINEEEIEIALKPTAQEPSSSRAAPAPTEAARLRADCQNHLKQLGLSLKIFASESEGAYWPTLSTEPGRLMFDAATMAKYLQGGRTVCACPGQGPAPESPDDRDYVYLGFAVQNEEDLLQFATAYHQVSTGLPDALEVWIRGEVATFPPSDSPSPRAGAPRVRRLREGVERFFITDINNPAAAAVTQSNIPVIIEWPDHHPTGTGKQGGNILYMDGHVEFVAYPGKWPMTEETMKILCNMAGRGPIVMAGN